MEILTIFLLICCVTLSWPDDTIEQNNENRQLAVVHQDSTSKQKVEEFSSLQDLAKNLSRSKGSFRENGDLRRSIVRKAAVSAGSNSVLEILTLLSSDDVDKIYKLELLEELQNLVHQFEIGIHFSAIGGFGIVSSFLFDDDDKFVSSALSVLSGAMQSNPTVQKTALSENFGKKLNLLLYHKSPKIIHKLIFTLSAFVRNFPPAQFDFMSGNGVQKLQYILKDPNFKLNTKLKIIDLISDLAFELETMDYEEKAKLQRLFIGEIHRYSICQHIIQFLDLDSYDAHQRTLTAMVTLSEICHHEFEENDILKKLQRIIDIYFMKDDVTIDYDLRIPLIRDMNILFKKFRTKYVAPQSTQTNMTFFTFLRDVLSSIFFHDEL